MESNKNINLYMFGRLVSYIGTGIQTIALPLYILDLTGSGLMMSLFYVLSIVPALIAAPFAGILGDRKNRKHIMVLTDILRAAALLVLVILAFMGNLNIIQMAVIQVFISVMDSIFNGASTALLPELISESSMMKVMSKRGIIDSAANIVGPAAGGVIYGFCGIKIVFLINAVSFLLSAVSYYALVYKKSTITKNEGITRASFIKDNKEVFVFFKRNKALIQLYGYAFLINLLLSPVFDVIFPYSIKEGLKYPSEYFGYIMSTFIIGMLIGNLIINPIHDKFNISVKSIMRVGMVFQAVFLMAFSIAIYPMIVDSLGGAELRLYIVLLVLILNIGILNALLNTPLQTNLQLLVPNDMKSRFFSIASILSQGAVPVGGLVCGILIDNFPYYSICLILSTASLVITFIFIKFAIDGVYEPDVNSENLVLE